MTRDEEILSHMGLVKRVALYMLPPNNPEFDDLVQDGVLGLMEALEKFDPTRSKFWWKFAWHRIHRRMQDGARKRSGVNSGYRQYTQLAKEKGQAVPTVTHVPIDDRDRAYTPVDPAIAIDVENALKTLTPRERALLHEIYWEGLYRGDGKRPRHELQDLNGTRKLTRAGVSHVHRTALKKLAGPLDAYKVTA